ncbi:MAG: hypothetical protein DMG10_30730 [Acidobacteria bacterium]|nr:MAG: hypothetical protein DMG10_30730 [Acidobacteriota bacterium]
MVTLSPTIRSLLDRPDLPELAPSRGRDEILLGRIQSLTPENLVAPERLCDALSGKLLRAGLLLWQDFLDAAHEIAQEIETQDGSYWHGFMHRREPDADNARYWFRQVGSHPIFPDLLSAATAISSELIKGATSCWSIRTARPSAPILSRTVPDLDQLASQYCTREGMSWHGRPARGD